MGRTEKSLPKGKSHRTNTMIFVTTGTHEQPFDRLVKGIDQLKKENVIKEDVYIQTGYSIYKPKFCEYSEFIDFNEMKKKVKNPRITITHGGPASIMLVLYRGKIPIVVPRQQKHQEHVDDHQVYFCRRFEEKGKIIAVYNIEEIKHRIMDYDELASILMSKKKEEIDPKEKLLKFTKALDKICIDLTKSKEKKLDTHQQD